MTSHAYPEYRTGPEAWIGDVPAHWGLERIKYGLTEKTTQKNPELPPGAISYGKVITKDAEKIAPETRATYQEVLAGEYLINPINLNYDLISLRTALSDIDVCVSPAYIILRAIPEKIHPVFGNYVLHVFDVRHMKTLGAGVRQTITFKDIGQCVWPLPPMEEQTAIARFLDRETGLIDGLIEKKTRFIALLKEKRAAVITHAVTKGINPDARMKDSGVDWLGSVPAHWQVTRLGYLGRSANGINIGGDAFGSGFPFISYGDVYKNRELPKFPEGLVQSTRTDRVAYSVKTGDILFTRTSETAEEIAFSSVCMQTVKNAVFAGFLIRFRPYPGVLDALFSKYAFQNRGLRDFYAKEMKLVTRASLSQGLLHRTPVPLPPLDEQERIAAYLEVQNEKIDGLIAKSETSIDLLREKRAALITAAVTGKIEVRAAA